MHFCLLCFVSHLCCRGCYYEENLYIKKNETKGLLKFRGFFTGPVSWCCSQQLFIHIHVTGKGKPEVLRLPKPCGYCIQWLELYLGFLIPVHSQPLPPEDDPSAIFCLLDGQWFSSDKHSSAYFPH